jgi:hypothetical protein
VPERASLDPYGHAERQEEEHADKDEDSVKIESWVASACRDEGDCTKQEKRCAIQQFTAKRKFCCSRTEPTSFADVRVPVCSAVQAPRHVRANLNRIYAKRCLVNCQFGRTLTHED